MAPYRKQPGVFCTAKDLIEIFIMLEGRLIFSHKNIIKVEIKAIYGKKEELDFHDIIFSIFAAGEIDRFILLVATYKERGITEEDWLMALEEFWQSG